MALWSQKTYIAMAELLAKEITLEEETDDENSPDRIDAFGEIAYKMAILFDADNARFDASRFMSAVWGDNVQMEPGWQTGRSAPLVVDV